ncbi:MAG: AAA family ATPase, partial [Phycisphaerales bacterium]|nr:AAA family ATPase [Phycisphaerales bacterium]
MFDLWGEKAIEKLIYSPEAVVAAVPRLNLEKAQAASDKLKLTEGTRRAKMDLLALLHGCGLPRKMVDLIVKEYGSAACEMIRGNPYLLMDFKGCGFLKADKLYLELGHDPAAMQRQALCVWYAIATSGQGDTWVHQNVGRKALERNIGGATPDFDAALAKAVGMKLLTKNRDAMGSTWLAEAGKAAAEDRVARYLTEAWEEIEANVAATDDGEDVATLPLWPEVSELPGLTEHQRAELEKATCGIVTVLAGSPGTGKTYCAAALIQAVIDEYGQDKVAVAAPTGKAAVRITEAIQRAGLNMKAVTIHSLLKVEASGGDGFTFTHGREFPLPFQFVVIDESSMIDTTLMASLLSARGPRTHYLFVGDTNQLAPV